MLGVLMIVYAFSFMDRQIVAILLEVLRFEFALSETQSGLPFELSQAEVASLLGTMGLLVGIPGSLFGGLLGVCLIAMVISFLFDWAAGYAIKRSHSAVIAVPVST